MTLQENSTGSEVKILQRQLSSLGYNITTIDGNFGVMTNEAVIKFQTDHDLTGDGIVGDATWAILDSLVPILADVYHGDSIDYLNVSKRVQGLIIKATEDNNDIDPHLGQNISGAKSIGVLQLFYHFVGTNGTAQEQYDNYKNALDAYGITKFRPIFDVEAPGITAELVQQLIALGQADQGLRPLIYITHSYWKEQLGGCTLEADIWLASWQFAKPTGKYLFWQWDDLTYPQGLSSCDINLFCGTREQLIAYANFTT